MTDMPASLREALTRTAEHPRAVAALGSTSDLFDALKDWQSELVAEAIDSGASWEDIGAALGTTRQAAWARFRSVAEELEGRTVPDQKEVKAMQQRVKDELRSLQIQLKSFDQKWREQQAQLRQQTRDLERHRADERKKLQQDVRAVEARLRAEIRALREPTS